MEVSELQAKVKAVADNPAPVIAAVRIADADDQPARALHAQPRSISSRRKPPKAAAY